MMSYNHKGKHTSKLKVSLLDYGAGNVRSVRNAIIANGYELEDITSPSQIDDAQVLVFPGVGSFQTAMSVLRQNEYVEPLQRYLMCNRPYLGICLGMQTLFESSEEICAEGETIEGLGTIPGRVVKFDDTRMTVPHIGWNGLILHKQSPIFQYLSGDEQVYFVHSYYAPLLKENRDWILTNTTYGGRRFVSCVQRGCVVACQFHPEKSGTTGLKIVKGFLESVQNGTISNTIPLPTNPSIQTYLTKRIVVALDVRQNDTGDLVVTKGDQYNVRENKHTECMLTGRGNVRNLGKPVSLARRYYAEGADEIVFLNITSFRHGVIEDLPMLQVLEEASRSIFVPLTVGGGIRSYIDEYSGKTWDALEVASRYFRAGADKVSIGSDAVYAAETFIENGWNKNGMSSIETISRVYGVQAVVISIDPKRIYLKSRNDCDSRHVVVELSSFGSLGPNGETYCWYQCTVKGGRETRNICAITLAKVCQELGAGEIMLNCIDMDGQCRGYDHALMNAVTNTVTIPVIASSGAGTEQHFTDVFSKTDVQAALAAGIFHRKDVQIKSVKQHMKENKIPSRTFWSHHDHSH